MTEEEKKEFGSILNENQKCQSFEEYIRKKYTWFSNCIDDKKNVTKKITFKQLLTKKLNNEFKLFKRTF